MGNIPVAVAVFIIKAINGHQHDVICIVMCSKLIPEKPILYIGITVLED